MIGLSLRGSGSPTAAEFERLFTLLLSVCGVVAAFVLIGLVVLVVRYHHSRGGERPEPVTNTTPYEVGWTAATTLIFGLLFVLGVEGYRQVDAPPRAVTPLEAEETLEILVTGKRWMWRFEHPSGVRELDELHVPVGRPVRLHMTSEDVIHSLFLPAFRIKQDLLPGTTTTVWFEAGEPGVYQLLCAEYCGNDHSRMRGRVVALEPEAHAEWRDAVEAVELAAGDREGGVEAAGELPAATGEALFHRYQCHTCHVERGSGPPLAGLYGRRVALADGRERVADEAYLRESILVPAAAVVAGYEANMPPYAGRLSEGELTRLLLYLERLVPEHSRR